MGGSRLCFARRFDGVALETVAGTRSPVIPLAPGPEFDIIRTFIAAANASVPLPVSVGDDAAGLKVPIGELLLLTADVSVEDVHFRREWMTWETVGYRAAAAALSDLAAMSASPLGVLVTLVLPPELDQAVVTAIGVGLGECLRRYETPLLGGDVSRSPGAVAVDVMAAGGCKKPVGRGGAEPGDELWVTGALGAAATALWDLSRHLEPDPRCRQKLERPAPRLEEAQWLAKRVELKAMIDLSDGLAGDAAHVAEASQVRLDLQTDAVPLAPSLQDFANRGAALRLAVAGGEDYELLLAAEPGRLETVQERFEESFELELTRVGVVREGRGVVWLDSEGCEIPVDYGGYDHFASGRAG